MSTRGRGRGRGSRGGGTTTTSTRSKKIQQKDIVFPLLVEAMNVCDDPFWKEKLDKASIGKLPSGFHVSDQYISHVKGSKSQYLPVCGDPMMMKDNFISFLSCHGSIFSPMDQMNSDQYFNTHNEDMNWASNKKLREVMLCKYAEKVGKVCEMTEEETVRLSKLLLHGLRAKTIQECHLKIVDGEIMTIEGLYRYSNAYFTITNEPVRKSSSSKKAVKDDASSGWEKYIKSVNKWHAALNANIERHKSYPVLKKDERNDDESSSVYQSDIDDE